MDLKIITWNIRGIGSDSKRRSIKNRILLEKPDMIILQETKCSEINLQNFIQKSWKKARAIATDAKGNSGGLAIIWDPNILHMEGFFSSMHTLSGWYRVIGTNQMGVITNVYGPQQINQMVIFLKHLSWL